MEGEYQPDVCHHETCHEGNGQYPTAFQQEHPLLTHRARWQLVSLYHSLYPYEVIFLNGRYCIRDARRAKFYDLMKVPVSMGTTKADAIEVTVYTGAYSHRVIGTGWVSITQVHHIY